MKLKELERLKEILGYLVGDIYEGNKFISVDSEKFYIIVPDFLGYNQTKLPFLISDIGIPGTYARKWVNKFILAKLWNGEFFIKPKSGYYSIKDPSEEATIVSYNIPESLSASVSYIKYINPFMEKGRKIEVEAITFFLNYKKKDSSIL